MTKRIASRMRFYNFLQRLQYKCLSKQLNVKIVNENYTSKMCCSCRNYKKDLGSNKIYNCDKCKLEIDRDINGAINILYRGIN